METFISRILEEHRHDPDVEFEARFGRDTHNGFASGVSKMAFGALMKKLERSSCWDDVSHTTCDDVYVEDVRNVFVNGTYVESVKKERMAIECFDDVKICASKERKVPRALGNACHRRSKHRKSFRNGCWRYDLTRTSSPSGDTYEVEIELCKNHLKYDSAHVAKSFAAKIRQLHDTIDRLP